MDYSQGFPLYDNISEALQLFSSDISNFPDEAKEKILNDSEFAESILNIANNKLIFENINKNHIPTLLDYLNKSNEYVECITLDNTHFMIYLAYKLGNKDMNQLENMYDKLTDFDKNKLAYFSKSHVYLNFKHGIKNKKLFNSLSQYMENPNDNDNNYLYIFPATDYSLINKIMASVFMSI